MKRAKFLRIPPSTFTNMKNKKEVIAKSRILEADGEKVVEISLYYKKQLKARYFADKENHYAWINDKWTTCRLDNVARMSKNLSVEKELYYWSNKEFVWDTKEDEQRAMDNWAQSADGLSAKMDQLRNTLKAEKSILSDLNKQYDLTVQSQGKNSKGAQELLIKIKNQEAAINKTSRSHWTGKRSKECESDRNKSR